MRKNYLFNFRISDFEYYFLQDLKCRGICISEYLRSTMKNTSRYKYYHKMING